MSGEDAENVSWSWLSLLQGWGSVTTAFTGKFSYIGSPFHLATLNPFDLRVDWEGWWFEHYMSHLQVFPGPGYLHSKDGVV